MSTLNPILMGKKPKAIIILNEKDVTTEDTTTSHMGMYIFDYLNELSDLTNINLNTDGISLLSSTGNYLRDNANIVNFKITATVDFPNNRLWNKFQNDTNLERVIFDCNVPDLRCNSGNLFFGCPNIKLLDLSKCTVITQSSSLAVQENTIIVVPDELYDTWITTAPWSNVASHIVKRSNYYNE